MSIADILTAIGNLGGLFMGLISLAALAADRRKRQAEAKKLDAEANKEESDAAQKVSLAAGNLVEIYDKRLCELEKRLAEQDQEMVEQAARIRALEEQVRKQKRLIQRFLTRITYLMSGIDRLLHQIVELEAIPAWKPDDWSPEEEGDDGN